MAATGRRIARISSKSGNDKVAVRKGARHTTVRRGRSRGQFLIHALKMDAKLVLGLGLCSALVVLFVINSIIKPMDEPKRPRVVTPLPGLKLMDLDQFQGEHRESLYWGTYRPHVYFGIRARTPRSLVAGLMWIVLKDEKYFLRHVCQDSDDLRKYGWLHHNGRDFGCQVLVDQYLNLTTSFVKSKSNGSGYGGDWVVRIDVQCDIFDWNPEILKQGLIFFYIADEDGNALHMSRDQLNFSENSLLASGTWADVDGWELHLKSTDASDIHFSGFRMPQLHNLSDIVLQHLESEAFKSGQLKLSDTSEDSPNILVFQISAMIPFQTDFAFISGTMGKSSRVKDRVSSLTGASLTKQLQLKQKEFDAKFVECFNITDKFGFESSIVGKAAIANMLGGIGYFYGQSKISYPKNSTQQDGHNGFVEYWPAELYTAVPSRAFFPRGFLWDEGFHQLLIWRWDFHLSLDIMGHWLDLMNIDGWIPREQILGSEALSKVPEEFVLQHATNGNPPTLFLVIHDMLIGMKKNMFSYSEMNEITSFLRRAFVRLEAWYQWFNTTQLGKEKGTYFWHGREHTDAELNPKTLSSGLDDYPRASHPGEEERHLDLRCWMLLAANSLHSITKLLEKDDDPEKYGDAARLLSDFEMLNQLHFDPAHGTYFDFGNHTDKIHFRWEEIKLGNGYISRKLVREALERPEPQLVPHIGYVSLFPFIFKIIPHDSWILDEQLDLISNKTILWTDYGLRSLAKTSSLYMKRNTEHDPPYWRGQIWINFNYLVLSALHHYSNVDGPCREKASIIYEQLRSNVIRNVMKNYQRTGFFWEQYSQRNGEGKGARQFTGWTSLVLLFMAESYP